MTRGLLSALRPLFAVPRRPASILRNPPATGSPSLTAATRRLSRPAGSGTAPRRAILGWLLFDWACQPFFTLVTTFVFAPYFATALAPNPVEGQALWGYATAAAGLTLGALSPVLGSIADASGPKKPWIALCGIVLVLACAVLWFAAPGASHAIALALL